MNYHICSYLQQFLLASSVFSLKTNEQTFNDGTSNMYFSNKFFMVHTFGCMFPLCKHPSDQVPSNSVPHPTVKDRPQKNCLMIILKVGNDCTSEFNIRTCAHSYTWCSEQLLQYICTYMLTWVLLLSVTA